jgi:hypothetical protein
MRPDASQASARGIPHRPSAGGTVHVDSFSNLPAVDILAGMRRSFRCSRISGLLHPDDAGTVCRSRISSSSWGRLSDSDADVFAEKRRSADHNLFDLCGRLADEGDPRSVLPRVSDSDLEVARFARHPQRDVAAASASVIISMPQDRHMRLPMTHRIRRMIGRQTYQSIVRITSLIGAVAAAIFVHATAPLPHELAFSGLRLALGGRLLFDTWSRRLLNQLTLVIFFLRRPTP